jgi:peptidoglycan LD-endopeptidase CwlK
MTIDSRSEEKLATVFPDIAVRWRRVAQDMWDTHKKQIRVTDGIRGFAEQWAIYALGRKKDKNGLWVVVDRKAVRTDARPGTSWHNYGLAIDICFMGGDPYLDKLPGKERDFLFEEYGRFVKAHGMQWGGDFNQNGKKDREDYDRPHCQLKYGLSIHEVQSLFEFGGIKAVWAKCNQILEGKKV